MKKIFISLAAAASLMTSVNASAIDGSLGDTNNDGAINAVDASLVLTEYACTATGKPSVLSENSKKLSDVNSDGKTDSIDASIILTYYAYTATGGKESFEVFAKNPDKYYNPQPSAPKPNAETTFCGTWGCGKSTINITHQGEGIFSVYIFMHDSAAAYDEWEYSSVFDGEKLVCEGLGSHVKYSAGENGEIISNEIFNNGSAEFVVKDNVLTWNDKTDDFGNGMEFIKNN